MSGVSTLFAVLAIVALVLGLISKKYEYFVWDRGKIGTPRLLKESKIGTDEIPALARALANGSAPVRYAALIFTTPDRPADDDALNIQMSIEDGRLGFDWVLLAPRNIEEQNEFRAFARGQGVDLTARSKNGVAYLRVEGVDAAKFTESVLTRFHHPYSESLGLVYEGFDWPQS